MSCIERVRVTLTATGNTWCAATSLTALGTSGRILAVKIREDLNSASGTSAVAYIAQAALSSDPDELDLVYQSGTIALTGSLRTCSWLDVLPAPSPYKVAKAGDLKLNAKILAGGGGGTTLYAEIHAEVHA